MLSGRIVLNNNEVIQQVAHFTTVSELSHTNFTELHTAGDYYSQYEGFMGYDSLKQLHTAFMNENVIKCSLV